MILYTGLQVFLLLVASTAEAAPAIHPLPSNGLLKEPPHSTSSLLPRLLARDGDSETVWEQIGQDLNGEAAFDRSGWSVTMSAVGSRVCIGALANDGGGADSGHVRCYQLSNNRQQWQQLGADINGDAGDEAGISVSLSLDGTTLAIGSHGISPYTGKVRVYRYSSNNWNQLGSDLLGVSERDRFGNSVSMNSDGTRLA
jgi:hypothetical protein